MQMIDGCDCLCDTNDDKLISWFILFFNSDKMIDGCDCWCDTDDKLVSWFTLFFDN